MLPMVLTLAVLAGAASGAGSPPRDRGPAACQRVACTEECWQVRVTYRQVVSPPGTPVSYETYVTITGGAWGDQAGARCYVDQVSREGFWLSEEAMAPGGGPAKVPAAAVDYLRIEERAF